MLANIKSIFYQWTLIQKYDKNSHASKLCRGIESFNIAIYMSNLYEIERYCEKSEATDWKVENGG